MKMLKCFGKITLRLIALQFLFCRFFFLIIVEELVVLYLSGESAVKTENSAQPG